MLNNKRSKCNPASLTSLSIRYDDDSYSSSRNAAVTSERFLRSASLLPAGEFLGWQIDTKTFSTVVFSGSGDTVTVEDLKWIFYQCATTSPMTSEWMEDLYAEERKVYMLSPVTGSTRDVDIPEQRQYYLSNGYRDDQLFRDLFCDMFNMMSGAGAVIRIIAGTSEKTKGHGMILISIPDKITLRMRSGLSAAFPHLAANEVDKLPEETEFLPDDCFMEGMSRMLSALMHLKDFKEHTDGTQTDGEKDEDDLDDTLNLDDSSSDDVFRNDKNSEDAGRRTDIDELELSIRTYHCLKRAGIKTVEELQELSDDELKNIRNLGNKSLEEIKRKLARLQGSTTATSLTETNYMAKLDDLIGLTDVKEQIRKIVAFAKMKRDMSVNGNANISVALNMGFIGNSGTAKTTVARIAAGIFYETGLLPGNELVEVGRADLVAKYIGHTAVKVKEVFARAKGKVLFIDEAYSLVDDRAGSFGDEAINTIIQEMENNRDKTIVIFAGYPDEMQSFFSRNPGLKSRVPFIINFRDYSANEMVKIAELEAKNRGFSIGTEAYEKVTAICSVAALRSDTGNGRFCRNLIENAILGYASRIYGSDGSDDDCPDRNYMLAADDFTSPTDVNGTKKIPFGFHV